MRCHVIPYVFIVMQIVLISTQPAYAVIESPTDDSLFYYKIGGGRHISFPPSLTITTIDLSASASFSNMNCGLFDPVASIEASLDDLKEGVDDAINALEAAAGAAIANLPGYILQKANPGLYDLFQNGLLRAQESFSLATKSCERMEHEISNGINPYYEWVILSRGDSWSQSIGVGEKNIHNASEEAETAHNNGVKWIGGEYRGGTNQPPIRVLSDTAKAGMNMLSDRPTLDDSNLPGDAALYQHFHGPSEVNEWIVEVLGDMEINICDSCVPSSQPGKGLIPHIEKKTEEISALLTDLVIKKTFPNRENLDKVAAPGIAITFQVLEAIQNQPPRERGIFIQKLSHEIAEARVMEKAMIIRRLILTGRKEGNIASIKMANNEINESIKELESEIDNVIFEKNTRNQFVSDTIVELLLKDQAMRNASVNTPALAPSDDRPIKQGVVEE